MMTDINQSAMVGPRAQLQVALLLVKRKVLNIDGTQTAVDSGRLPNYCAIVVHCRPRRQLLHHESTIGTKYIGVHYYAMDVYLNKLLLVHMFLYLF